MEGASEVLVTGSGVSSRVVECYRRLGPQEITLLNEQLKELKQVARDILNWVFNEWLEHNGYEDKIISYIFNDLDLTDEIGIKRLYVELYDRNLISRETMRLKMGLNPKVEKAHVEKESKAPIGLHNEDAKTIIDLVNNGVVTVEQARELFGLDEEGRVKKK